MKERYSISIDDDSIKAISSLSAQTGLTKSFIVGKYIKDGLKSDLRLTHSERYFHGKAILFDKINLVFESIGMKNTNHDIKPSILILSTIPKIVFKSNHEYGEYKLSLYHLLDTVMGLDRELYQDIISNLNIMGITLNLNLDVSEVSEGFKTSEKCEIF
jgi:hypothetical protein